jgi:DHA1 family inner membrane transport protein
VSEQAALAAEVSPAATATRRALPTRRPGLALLALAICTFAIGTTEFVITGLLPDIAADYRVSIVTAGYLVSGYALGVVVGAPVVTAAVLRLPRKRVLLGLLVLFVVGNLLSGTAPSFTMMMSGRVVAALCHGAFIGVAAIVAAGLVAPHRKATAIAAMLTGLTVANVAGVPLGALLGQHFGWRSTFLTIAALGLMGMIGVAGLVPGAPGSPETGLRRELRAFRRVRIWRALAMTAMGFGAVYAPLTFVAPLMTSVAGFQANVLPWLLMLFGSGLVVGNLAGARAADHWPTGTLVALLAGLVTVLCLLYLLADWQFPAAATLFALGIIGFATVPGFTTLVITSAGPASNSTMASSAAVAAFNLGNAAGAYFGGLAISSGLGYASTSLVGAAMAAGALLLAAASATPRRRAREITQSPS